MRSDWRWKSAPFRVLGRFLSYLLVTMCKRVTVSENFVLHSSLQHVDLTAALRHHGGTRTPCLLAGNHLC